jgi:general secretion pathway protein L
MNLKDFLDWWFAQLRSLVPDAWSGFLQRREPAMAIAVDHDMVRITPVAGGDGVVYSLATLDPFRDRGLAKEDLGQSAGMPQRISMTVSPRNYLLRDVTVPRAARGHFAETVGYQISTLTPFTSDAVLYACGEKPHVPAEGPVPGWLVIVPLQPVLQALSLVDQAPPENPLALAAPPAPGEPLSVSWRITDPHNRPHTSRRFVWLGLAFVWVLAIGLHLYNRENDRSALEEQLAELRQEANEVITLRANMDASVDRLRWVSERKSEAFSSLVVVNALAELLDDDSWLQRLDFDGENLTLTGVSKTPSTLIETLEASSTFEAVRFDALTRDRRNAADRFNLSAKLQKQPDDGDS